MQARSPWWRLAGCLALAAPALIAGCKNDTPPEPVKAEPSPSSRPAARAVTTSAATGTATATPSAPVRPSRRKVNARPVATVTPSEDDPLKGKWSLADATESIKGTGALLADIEVELPKKGEKGETGKLTCALFEDRAPLTVANFIGLARGTRPWKTPEGKWAKKAAYDGTIFHRIIKGFMIQGGDAVGTGTGEPGYVIPDEVWEDANHDRPGLLCMANRGPNTNGAQFFITDAAAAHLDNGYTIFGECSPVDFVHKIASTEVKGEKPASPPKIKKVTIRRGPSPLPSSSSAPAASSAGAASSAAPAPAPAATGKP
jgi:peptidyl-prolyl cis-trans isomerase A (cyclophilin A)